MIDLHVVTLGPQEDFNLDLACAVLLCLHDSYESDVLVLVATTEGE